MDTGALALSDFGLARVGAPTESASAVIGTRAYAALEVAVGARASARTEVFALGKLLLHLVSGTRPEPGIPDAVAIPGDQFRPIVQRATQPTPAARYASVPELLADLEERVTSVRMKTERPDDTMRRLREVLRNQQQPTIVTLRELLQTALGPAREQIFRPGQPYRDSLPDAIAYLSRDAIQTLWTEAAEDLVKLVEAYSAYTASARGFPFAFCDSIADFFARAATMTGDARILRAVARALPPLGANHNRFYVRAVFLGLMQRVRTFEEAASVLAALASVDRATLHWCFAEFSTRTLAGPLRDVLQGLLEGDQTVLAILRS